jgi:hypothetical protein
MSTPEPATFTVEIDVNVRPSDYSSNGLRLSERLTVSAGDFFQLAAILGQFHELAEKIKNVDA